MREGELKKKNTILIFIFRVVLILSVLLLQYLGGFTLYELQKLLYIMLPLTFLYLALVVKFMSHNRYLPKGEAVTKTYYYQGIVLLGLIYLAELILILIKGLFNWISIEVLYTAVFIIECGLGVYAGLYLSDLYAKNTTAPSKTN